MVEGVVNELSFRQPDVFTEAIARDENDAFRLMSGFVRCISEGVRRSWIVGIRTSYDFQTLEIAPSYSLIQWRNDRRVNRDERALFRSFLTASPYLTVTEREVRFRGTFGEGLSCCVLTNGILISWNSHSFWEEPKVTAQVLSLTESGEISTSGVTIRNVSRLEHWDQHEDWISVLIRGRIQTGSDLIEKWDGIFPHLLLGVRAARQIASLTGGERHFEWVVSSLLCAEFEMKRWKEGPFIHARLPGPASPESETVNNSPQLRSQRVFETEQGRYEYCEFHMKNNSENQRIHYLCRPTPRRMVIAYVGTHLETATY